MSGEDNNLSEKSKAILRDTSNTIYVSLVSFWEIAIKHSGGKLELDVSLRELLNFAIDNQIEILPAIFEDYEIVDTMSFPKINATEHRDPFDRLLIAQAQTHNLHIISCDTKFDSYKVVRIW